MDISSLPKPLSDIRPLISWLLCRALLVGPFIEKERKTVARSPRMLASLWAHPSWTGLPNEGVRVEGLLNKWAHA